MPILSDNNNPPSKSFECSILEKEGTWWVAKLKPRQEKAFAFDLLEHGIDYYLPFYEKRIKRIDGKFRKSTLVLFPSYVSFISEKPFDLLQQNRIVTILPILAQERFKREIHGIYLTNNNGFQIVPADVNPLVRTSDVIEIITGPLIGVNGTILEVTGKKVIIILSVHGLGNAKVRIDAGMVRKTKRL